MTTHEERISRVLAELDVHIAEVEASVTVLKALLADDLSARRRGAKVT
jgi:hypothetical protein